MRSAIVITLALAVFALAFPLAVSAGNPIRQPDPAEPESVSPPLVYTETSAEEQTKGPDSGVTVRLKRGDEITELPMDEYLIGVVSAEMPASFETEALKAQAAAARTYTLYKMEVSPSSNHPEADVCDDVKCCKAYKDAEELREKWGDDYDKNLQRIRSAVKATDGQFVKWEDEPILAVFHSSSTGKTESSENVWGAALPYLTAVDSMENGDSVPNYNSTVTVSLSVFKDTVKEKYPAAEFGDDPGSWVTDTVYSDSGRLLTAVIGGQEIAGTELRTMFDLRSTGMTITADSENVTFSVTGYGHGVGMSQYGANEMAKSGSNWKEILAWYYPGTEIAAISN